MSGLLRGCQAFVTPNHLGPDARKCGKDCVPGKSYCPEHNARFVIVLPLPGPKSVKKAAALIDNGGFS